MQAEVPIAAIALAAGQPPPTHPLRPLGISLQAKPTIGRSGLLVPAGMFGHLFGI